jgi:hypothetical protein
MTVQADVTKHGADDVETGCFLLAPAGTNAVTTVALAGSRGINRRPDHLSISRKSVSQLFRYATLKDLTIIAQLHSHRERAFLSGTDLKHGYSVEGFTTAVIPYYQDPPFSPSDWGWWRYENGRWQITEPFELDAEAAVSPPIVFDEDGVHAA